MSSVTVYIHKCSIFVVCLFLLFLKEQVHISYRDSPLPPRKAISKSSQIPRILLSTVEAYLVYSGGCQIGENAF